MKKLLWATIVALLLIATACNQENTELKTDAEKIAGVMCKSIGAMKDLRAADPADSAKVAQLRSAYEKIESEMQTVYQAFHEKYGDKANTKEFGEEFRKYLNKAMLGCNNLSKEDRENFEREVSK